MDDASNETLVGSNSIWHLQVPESEYLSASDFFSIGFTQHRTIVEKVKNRQERCFYIHRCAEQHYTVEELKSSIYSKMSKKRPNQ